MKNKRLNFLILGLACISTLSCNKAKENLDILINADVIHYSLILRVDEITGGIPQNLTINILDEDANIIYDITGKKELTLKNGMITLGVHPKYEPTIGKPVKFRVKVFGPGYLESIVPIIIDNGQFNQVKDISILKVNNLPESVSIKNETAPLADNGMPVAPIVINTPVNTQNQEVTTITIPAHTQFLNASGSPLIGSSVDLQVINFNTQDDDNINYFPGGQLNATPVTINGNEKSSVSFMPAAFAKITLIVNNKTVSKFDQPINVSFELNPNYKMLSTGVPVKAGDVLSIWSFSEDSGNWSYEKEVTVAMVSGKPVVHFTTNHLSYYSVAEYVETTSCNAPTFIFNAQWLKKDTQPLILEIWNADATKKLLTRTIIVNDGLAKLMNDIPSFGVTYKILTAKNEELASGTISNPCLGGKVDINVSAPSVPVTGVTLSLIVKCPDKGIITPPDFYMFYRVNGALNSKYQLLGVVRKGILSTTLLTIGQHYDFKAQWGSREKIIKNYLIDKDNLSTTVGPDDHIGNISPDKNLTILIEECNKI